MQINASPMKSVSTPTIQKRKKSVWRRMVQYKSLYLFLLPAVVYLAIFHYGPMYGVLIAFQNFNGAKGIWGSDWVGLRHFEEFITGQNFWPIMSNTLSISLYTLIACFPFPIIVALCINELKSKRYAKFVQTVLYAPHFISTVVLVGIIVLLLSPNTGLINNLLALMGKERVYFMVQPSAFKHIYVWSGVWQSTGWSAIIYLAALSSVDPALHEAAMIDGANRLQRIWHINLPTMKPTIVILLIMKIGSLIGVGFEKAFLLQNSLNLEASEVISTYVYRRGLLQGGFSYSAAVGLFNTVINIILLFIANSVAKKVNETSLF